MPDNSNNVIFGAEFEGEGFRKGAAEIITTLKDLKAANEDLAASTQEVKAANASLEKSNEQLAGTIKLTKASNADLVKVNKELEKDMKFQEQQIKSLDKEYAGLNRATKDGRTSSKELAAEIRSLKKDLEATGQQVTKNNLVIAENIAKMKADEQAIRSNSAAIKANGETIKSNEATVKDNAKAIGDTEKQFKKVEEASGKSTVGIGKLYGGLRTMAALLPGIGLAGLIGLIVEFGAKAVEAFFASGKAVDEYVKKQKLFREVAEEAAKGSGEQIAKLQVYKDKLNDLSIPESQRLKVLNEYNKVADSQNQIDKTQINNLDLINQKIDQQIQLIKERSLAVAATAKLGSFADKVVEKEFDVKARATAAKLSPEDFQKQVESLVKQRGEVIDKFVKGEGVRSELSEQNQKIDLQLKKLLGFDFLKSLEIFKERDEAKKAFDDAAKSLEQLITVPGLTTHDAGKKERTVENVFKEKLAELRERLASAMVNDFQSEPLINRKFEEQLNKEFGEIEKLLKEKKLTLPQSEILKGLLTQINQIDLSKSIADFRQKQREALDRVNDAISQAVADDGNKRVANIRNEFEREKETIANNFEVIVSSLDKRLKESTKAIEADLKKGFLTEGQAKEKRTLLTLLFQDLFTQAEIAKGNAEIDLAFKTFQNTIKEGQRATDEILTQVDENTANRIGKLTEAFFAGTIPYKKYQDELTKITREAANARREVRITELREELNRVNEQFNAATDAGNKKKLEDQQRQIRGQIATLRNEMNQDAVKQDEEASNKRLQSFLAYANGLQNLLSSVVSFWNQVNQTESAALDRSIALQQRRVDNAKDIAEKGNAEYLELEQKRLDELERKREENARKQIAINNALTLSQATVAAISAIAQAVSTGSPLAAIAALAAVIGAIGAAFAFVNSLQPQSTSFYEGKEYIEGTGRPRGKDTVPARLNIGERVITTDKNLKYWDTLHAIHNNLIPANVLNTFVNQYPVASIPTVDFNVLTEATNHKLSFDSFEIANELKATNEKLDMVVEAIGGIGFYASVDENGLALSINKVIAYKNKLKKA